MIRARLILAGIPDPLRQLPDMHAVFDVAEQIITEHMDADQLDSYNKRMYVLTKAERARRATSPAAEVDTAVPPEFSVAEQRQSFSSFARLAGATE